MFLNYEIKATSEEVKGYIQTLDENNEIINLFYYEYNAYGATLNPIDAGGNILTLNMAVNKAMVQDFIAKFEI